MCKNFFKCIIISLLYITMIMGYTNLNVFADEKIVNVSSEIVDLGEVSVTYSGGISTFSTENGEIDLRQGNYEKWIERIDAPDYAVELYNKMVEYSDNDGEYDLLITAAGQTLNLEYVIEYEEGTDIFNAIKITTLKNPTQNEIDYVHNMTYAIYGAYIMDHPEVFWLQGSISVYQVIYSYENGDVMQDFYLLINMHEGSVSESYNEFFAQDYQTEEAIIRDIEIRDNAVETILNSESVTAATNDYEFVKAFNDWLTKNNEYNTSIANGNNSGDFRVHNCLSALVGSEKYEGPVCEAYAKAFKILCDRKEIPCVLVIGDAYSTPDSTAEAHCWNYTKINESWYGVDITWNDPVVQGIEGKISGYENENYLLVGSQTIIDDMTFSDSHVPTNDVFSNGLACLNGPVIETEKYNPAEQPEEEKTYTISWDIDGNGTIDETENYQYGDLPSHIDGVKPANEQYSYVFTGWSPSIVLVDDDITYTAQFDQIVNIYTIGWDIDGDGNVDEQENYEYGAFPSHTDGVKPADEQYSYVFIGWSPYIKKVTEDMNYTAKFTEVHIPQEEMGGVIRISGLNFSDTSLLIADAYKKELGVDKFDSVIVSVDNGFADILSAPCLAYAKEAPIILIDKDKLSKDISSFIEYIKTNLKDGGDIYCLYNDVASYLTAALQEDNFKIHNLIGVNRYYTNLNVLRAAENLNKEIVVISGRSPGNGISALALNKPVLMVNSKLEDYQKTYLERLDLENIYIVGNTDEVSSAVEENLKEYGTVMRIAASDYINTSIAVASQFFENPTSAVLTTVDSLNREIFYGICGSPLAAKLGIPLILTDEGNSDAAISYAEAFGVAEGYVIAKPYEIKDETIVDFYSLTSPDDIQLQGVYIEDSIAPQSPLPEKPGEITSSSITLRWLASETDDDVVKYEIVDYNTNKVIAVVTDTSIELTGLKANTEYKIVVYAIDAAGNKSEGLILKESTSGPNVIGVHRVSGSGRVETGLEIANKYMELSGIDKLETIIVARSDSFADALSASYLAYVKDAPIILTNEKKMNLIVQYINSKLESDGCIYIIGGTSAISSNLENSLSAYNVKRISGKDRYVTNLEILKEAGVSGGELIVATGQKFADSLSASAVKKPILMVNRKLTKEQKTYLASMEFDKIYIIGGISAVSVELEKELMNFSVTDRISGRNRNETSVEVAKKFFAPSSPNFVVIANSKNYPDGLCGGPIATLINAPLILTSNENTAAAAKYVNSNMIGHGLVLGGDNALTNDSVNNIFF